MRNFEITGKFRRNRKWQQFVKVISAIKESDAKELILSTIGSQQHVKRYEIKLEKIEEVKK
ncbi:MAG: 50S ribosomal protein L18a [Candidatus Helarchaeota archaeon]|nr:50S ribosomal protein L18a [Candidatus Helarchaeota archaeon]